MDQSPTLARRVQVTPSVATSVHGVPDEYVHAFPAGIYSSTLIRVLYEGNVDPDYALAYGKSRTVWDIAILWRRGVESAYALQFGARRDLTVLDIADRWDERIPAEFATLV